MGTIFISYRRDDTKAITGRLCDRLKHAFGDANVVFDVESIHPGIDFKDALHGELNRCAALVAVIGARWLTTADPSGMRRLDQPSDWVRIEIESALKRNIPIIPVLAEATPMPGDDDLPGDLKPLAARQGTALRSGSDFDADMERLIQALCRFDGIKRLPGVPLAPVANRLDEFFTRFQQSYSPYSSRDAALTDPQQVYIPLRCLPVGQTEPQDAFAWLETGLQTPGGQLLLADYGMGKSFVALRLFQELARRHTKDERAPIPILFPLKRHRLIRSRPDALLDDLREFLTLEHFPRADEVGELLRQGRLVLILDGIDEISLVQTADPLGVLDRLDVTRFGPCPWIATSRVGLFARVLSTLSQSPTRRAARLQKWDKKQWRRYLDHCDVRLKLFDDGDNAEKFSQLVEEHPRLRELTDVPLYARMLVETWRGIMAHPDRVDLISLYREYADFVLAGKQDATLLQDIDLRRRCLEAPAVEFFRKKTSSCAVPDLIRIADAYVREMDCEELASFVRTELQTYSLLACDASGRLSFSHKSFQEYFLAQAILRELLCQGLLAEGTLIHERLESGEAAFLAALLAEQPGRILLNEIEGLVLADNSHLEMDLRRNLLLIALAANSPLEGADLRKLDLSGLDLSSRHLSGANFSEVQAVGVDFSGSDLSGCSFTSANLDSCSFTGTNLTKARLRSCTITNIERGPETPALAGADLKRIKLGRRDAAYLRVAVINDDSADEDWKQRALEAIDAGVLDLESTSATGEAGHDT